MERQRTKRCPDRKTKQPTVYLICLEFLASERPRGVVSPVELFPVEEFALIGVSPLVLDLETLLRADLRERLPSLNDREFRASATVSTSTF